MQGEDTLHTVDRKDRISKYSRFVGEPEELRKVLKRSRGLLSTDHCEVLLQSIQIRKKYHTGLVEPCGSLEDVAAERHGGLEQLEELVLAAPPQRG